MFYDINTLSRKTNPTEKNKLKEVAAVFLKMGCFAFGGPAAHIAMMEDEIVSKRKWNFRDQFLDHIGATSLIPEANSTEMTVHCSYHYAEKKGLFLASKTFIIPAINITGVLAYFYITNGNLPGIKPFFIWYKPAVIAVIAAAVLKFEKKTIKSIELAVNGLIVLGLT
ncbi:chromate transporter [Dokdonia sp. Hel_I_53]|uniref:chromate transporter n=1 Tax=Dokdonia sp. Hel_I_53 TaxID=1566287 RepID=UPI0021BD2138|nr:chromate transporter [Dokdonia sp. Hel_I_53]